jgi:hypothetical protein
MASVPTPEILAALEARQLAFLEARLVSDEAEREWRANFPEVRKALNEARLGDMIDPRALADALERTLTGAAVRHVARPIAKRALPLLLAELRADRGKVGERVPPDARARLEALLSRPGSVPDRLLREIAEQDAIEEILRDVLYDGFKEFAERVNPFTAEWGIPSLLKRMSVFGGAMAKGIEAVKAEFDRRLEPEIRRYLAGFTRRGLDRMVDVTIARADQPASIALRRHVLAWMLEQEIAVLAREADENALELAQEIGLDIAAAELDRAEGRARRRATLERLVEDAKDHTVAQALAALGVTVEVDDEAVARALWPFVRTLLSSEPVRAWIANLVAEFYARERAALGGSAPT